MVNTRRSNGRQKEDQDASVMACVTAPNDQSLHPLEDTSKNQEENSRLSLIAEVQQMFRDTADQNCDQIDKIIEEKIGSIRPPGCSYKTFLDCNPPDFFGSPDPTAILHWVAEMEMAFDCCECGDEQKVKFAVRMLTGKAFSWWNVTRNLMGNETVCNLTWANFVERIKERYCSEYDFKEMKKQFLSLEKGKMSIERYACGFIEKLQYVGHLASDDKACVARFVRGLPWEYLNAVRIAETLDSAIKLAMRVENESEEGDGFGEKRKWEGTCGSLKKSKGEDKPCYRCGKVGHLARECRSD